MGAIEMWLTWLTLSRGVQRFQTRVTARENHCPTCRSPGGFFSGQGGREPAAVAEQRRANVVSGASARDDDLVEKVGLLVTHLPIRKDGDTFFNDPHRATPTFLADRNDEPAQARDHF